MRELSPEGLGSVGAQAAPVEQTLDSMRRELECTQVLLGLSGSLGELRTPEEILERAVLLVPRLFGADRCFAARVEPLSRTATVVAASGYDEDTSRVLADMASTPGGLPVTLEALTERTPLLVPDVAAEPRMGADESARRRLGAYIVIPLIRWGAEFGGLGIEFEEARPLGPREFALAHGAARQLAVSLANARQLDLLGQLRASGLSVGSKLRLAPTVQEVVAAGARLLAGDGAILYFIEADSRTLVRAAAWGDGPAETLVRVALDSEPWSDLPTGGAVVIPELPAPEDEVPAGGVAVGILGGEDRVLLGALLISFRRPRGLSPDELEALNVFAAQCAVALENAHRFERQRQVARSLQQGLLTTETPEMENCTVGAIYEPASGESDIGGDFFDVFELDHGRVALVVGDVSGKGAEAAAQTAMAKYMLRAFATRNPAPSSVMFHLNNALVKAFQEDRFTTLAYAVIDPKTLELQLALAGHPPPLVYRRGGADVEVVHVEGPILGAFEEQQFDHAILDLEPGDVFLSYTDGLTETRRDGDLFGLDRVKESLRKHAPIMDAEPLARAVYEDAAFFGSITDDTIVFTFRCLLDE